MKSLLMAFLGGVFHFDLEAMIEPAIVLPGVQALSLATDPSNPSRTYCATYNRGLWRTEDSGASWLPIGTPQHFLSKHADGAIDPRETTFVSVSARPGANGRHAVWVGTEPSSIYRSISNGETFEQATVLHAPSRASWSFPPRPESHHVQCIAEDSDGHIHVAIEAGAMLRSHDGGRTFQQRLPGSPVDTHVLLTHPLAPRHLFAALGDALMRSGRSFGESRDGGSTWTYVGKGLEDAPYLYGLAINPQNPEDIRVAGSRGANTAHFEGGASVFRRQRDTWIEEAEGFPSDHSLVPVLAADATEPGRWFALSNLGLFMKDGHRARWECLTAPSLWRTMHPMSLAILRS